MFKLAIKLIYLTVIWFSSISELVADDFNEINCERIVSLAPSITETIYDLNIGSKLVGVTRFCRFPTEATLISQIGGLLDPNIEAIVSLRPSLVVVLKEQSEVASRLNQLGIRTISVEHRNVEGILQSLLQIGKICNNENFASSKVNEYREKIKSTMSSVKSERKPRVMIVVGRTAGSDSLEGVFVSGNDGYYNDLVNMAGGVNVNQATTASFPILSREGIIKVDPEVVIEIVMTPPGGKPIDKNTVINQWQAIPYISAVKNNRIFVFDSDYVSVPGPRFIKLFLDIVRAIHSND